MHKFPSHHNNDDLFEIMKMVLSDAMLCGRDISCLHAIKVHSLVYF